PRRYADYAPSDGFTWENQVSTVGAFILAASTLPFLWNVYTTWRNAPKAEVDDPSGYGRSLEWATSSPPPRHNFTSLPRIRSEAPAFDLPPPEVAAMDHAEPSPNVLEKVYGEADRRGEKGVALARLSGSETASDTTTTTIVDDPRTTDE